MLSRSRLALVVGAVALTLGGGISPANAATDAADAAGLSIKLADVVTAQAGGAGVVVTMDIRCEVGAEYTYASVRVTQNQSGSIVAGEAYTPVACTGTKDRLQLGLTAFDPDGTGPVTPFDEGTAFVSATIEQCAFDCLTAESNRTLPVVARTVDRAHYEHPSLTLDLPARGRVVAGGAGAVVVIEYTCAAGVQGYFSGGLAQLSSTGTVTWASDYMGMTCNAQTRSGVMTFHATSSAWERGETFFTMVGEACDASGCFYPSAFRTVKLNVKSL